ncbi:DUF2142 domain-containing protein [Nocardioides euryhalodurans]|nr:DUF2142 domain-containing protein [Nocardioides euryhalodurans]
MPPFAGIDEFDHAYRASAAGHGELFTDLGRPDDGRGLLVTVNDGIADAARPLCESLDYPGADNCRPTGEVGVGQVAIASAAAIYQPTYYLAVGWPTWFLDGNAALYAMRILSALLCATLFGATVWTITGWARSAWPLVAAAVVLTPTTVYSLVLVAPNGVEVMLALALWACLLGTTRPADDAHRGRLLLASIPLAATFAWIRPFSPVWLLLILCVWIVLLGQTGVRDVLRRHRRLMAVATVVIGCSAVTSTLWVLAHPSPDPAGTYDMVGSRLGETLGEIPLWFFQVISAAPFRGNAATLDVYVAGLVMFAFLLLPLVLTRVPRLRVAALAAAIGAVAVGAWYTYSRLPTAGTLWQGRYSWCLALGVVLMAGIALEERPLRMLKTLGLVFGVPSLFVMHVRCLQFVLGRELDRSPLTGDPAWITAPFVGVAALATMGLACWVYSCWRAHHALGAGADREGAT